MAINNNRDRQRTRVVYVPVNTGGGSKIETEELNVSENGTYEAGKDKAYSKVTVKVTEPLGTIKIADYRIKFAYSSFSKVPKWADFEGVTDMSSMFLNCISLTSVPEMNTSQVTNMMSMFEGCSFLTSVPEMNTSQVTNMESMFKGCSSLTSVPGMNTSQVTNMMSMFEGCSSLTSVPEMNTSRVTDMNYMFRGCTSLTELGGFVGLKADLKLSNSRELTHNSIMNVINKAADVTAAPATLTLGSTNLAKLTDEEKGIATAKGWTLA